MNTLVKRAMNHDVDAFVELMEKNTASMYKVARAFLHNDDDIADAIQDTILTCLEKIGTLREPKYFKTWMIRILINHCNDILKEKKKQCCYEEVPEIAQMRCSGMNDLEVKDLLERLDDKYKAIIILHYLEGFSVTEIGKMLDMKTSTVKTRLSRGRKELRKLYGVEPKNEAEHMFLFAVREVNHYGR
ncbi:MAG: sigma-70 family RNA polymerase sigma factor [Lachnospiraceae bacterium]|nr:sigma-70 family RNA polymerase sigma factor [Lachnospiraceae bacterium]